MAVDPVVETTNGKLRGRRLNGARAFLGVRYGASTAGAARFTAPRPVESWAGIVDAVEHGPSAPQGRRPHNTDPFFSWYSEIRPLSEDCLRLNIFAPDRDGQRRPVMVWLHGGGWREFSGTAPGFDGTALAQSQDVVVVTVNHRLNAFGFLKFDVDDDRFAESANVGMLDIVAALKWVRDNIDRFGGDPANVTVFGESGGASKTSALLAVPAAKGLFHKAILQSSGGGLKITDEEAAARMAHSLAAELDVPRLDPEALQNLSMDQFSEAVSRTGVSFRGSLDGRTFDHHPFDGSAAPEAAGIPMLVGSNRHEVTYYLRDNSDNFDLTADEAQRRLAILLQCDEPTARHIFAGYQDCHGEPDASRVMILVASDFIFKRTAERIATLQSAHAPTWLYQFDWESPVEGGRMGAFHTVEVPFIFGTAKTAKACLGEGPDLARMERMMMGTWAAFARHGNPGNPSVPDWAAYAPETRQTMCLNTEPSAVQDPGGAARTLLSEVPEYGYGHKTSAIKG